MTKYLLHTKAKLCAGSGRSWCHDSEFNLQCLPMFTVTKLKFGRWKIIVLSKYDRMVLQTVHRTSQGSRITKNHNFWSRIYFVICQIVHAWKYTRFNIDSCCQNIFCEFWTLITDFSLEIQLNRVMYYSSDISGI